MRRKVPYASMLRPRTASDPGPHRRAPASERGRVDPAAFLPVLFLGAAATAFFVIKTSPGWFPWVALGAVLAVAVGWVVISVLWPGRADRVCPACGAEAVERTAPDALVGRRCSACGWHDETESAWMIAEEEAEALEPLVLKQRTGSVDSSPPGD